MKRLILPLLLAASPAFAQDRMDMETCQGGWNAVMTQLAPDLEVPVTTVSDDGWCVVLDLVVPIDRGSSAIIETVKWRAGDMDRVFEEGLPPRSFEMAAEGLSILPQTGDPIFDYLFGLQSRQSAYDFGITLRWDGVQNAILLDEAYFDFYPGNTISATGRMDGVDLTDLAAIQRSAGTAGLRDLSMVVEFDGWFESIIALPLGTSLLSDRDTAPEVQVEALRRQAVEFASQIPDGLMPEPSRDALVEFLTSLPHPRGKAQVQLSTDPVIGMTRLLPFVQVSDGASVLETIPVALDGVNLLMTWTPKTGD